MMKNKKNGISLLLILFLLIGINLLSGIVFKRFDFTHDKRYTLSETTRSLIHEVKEPMLVEVFLEGNFPGEIRKLQVETQQLLEEFSAINSEVYFKFVNPHTQPDAEQFLADLHANGMKPLSVTVNDRGKQSQEMVFPWAVITYGEKYAIVPLMRNVMSATLEENINSSVQYLEYALAEGMQKVIVPKSKKIAIIKGIDAPNDMYFADLLMNLRESYFIAPFTLDSIQSNPNKTLQELKEYDLAMVIKPNKTFSESDVQVLDQYIMNGGKTMWLIDEVQAEMDSLMQQDEMLTYPKETGLNEMFFKYGLRINPVLVKDEMGTPIRLATGRQGSETTYENFIWKFAPFAMPSSSHPIVKNLEGIKFDFANSIDTLKNHINKTVLLQSSPYSSVVGSPGMISLQMLNEEVGPDFYEGKGNIPLAVLLEGEFTSTYNNRILPFQQPDFVQKSQPNKMIVVADGDIARNQLDDKKLPMELGYDKWTNTMYGNKEFMLNAVNYLLDDSGLMNLRNKTVKLPLLDKEKVYRDYSKIQLLVVGLPLIILLIFAGIFYFIRQKKYQK
ncbi:MAG TPA: gliding motility-associated ABC transporter substrate-binding protein GldG [Flavobacterium sp.]|nr:gliding motility-associated ABC transporter substrate-binding protein GldG [Flavobacterium sp.]